jgi:hypothetical protein
LNLAQLDDLICAVLRGENVMWSSARGDDFEGMFIRRVEYHGVSALLQERMPQLSAWPSSVQEAVRRRALAQALWELRHQQVLGELIDALSTSIEPVMLKGTALAYGLYANPVWRARGDTDMIVAHQDYVRASETLLALGFRPNTGVSGEFRELSGQLRKRCSILTNQSLVNV